MIRLELPNIKYKKTYLETVKEFLEKGSDNVATEHYFRKSLDELEHSFELFVQEYLDKRTRTPTKERVPSTQFWIIDENDEYCGRISLRHYLNEELSKHGGHIGYDIRPSKRGKSYASIALGLCLLEAKKLGLDRVFLTCDDDNYGSIKTIEKNGGVLQDKVKQDNGVISRRYWIELK
ncbi:MAG: GNAT family N-acetyltransferase [Candidatus Woesearchaeota archaeon]